MKNNKKSTSAGNVAIDTDVDHTLNIGSEPLALIIEGHYSEYIVVGTNLSAATPHTVQPCSAYITQPAKLKHEFKLLGTLFRTTEMKHQYLFCFTPKMLSSRSQNFQ